jgi:hypothetical protein
MNWEPFGILRKSLLCHMYSVYFPSLSFNFVFDSLKKFLYSVLCFHVIKWINLCVYVSGIQKY